jgi:hypothetical protein
MLAVAVAECIIPVLAVLGVLVAVAQVEIHQETVFQEQPIQVAEQVAVEIIMD